MKRGPRNLRFQLKYFASRFMFGPIISLLMTGTTPVLANPTGANVVSGQASVAQAGAQTTVTQTSQNALIQWQNFNIGKGETTQFVQPNSSAIALNRVVGGNPTQILGTLKANGQVWIVNSSGVFFAKGAQVDVAGLIATTSNISNANFTSGQYVFDQPTANGAATVENQGSITVADQGLVALAAPGVANSGTITARLGHIALASTGGFTVDLNGDGLFNFVLGSAGDAKQQNTAVSNSGQLIADGGLVEMTANDAGNVLNQAINQSGIVEARSIANQNGKIVLSGGPAGTVSVSGTVDASGTQAGQSGGTISITGDVLALAGAQLYASGDAQGGSIETSGTVVDAGGATITAAAAHGHGGTWLVDPYDLTVDSAAATTIDASLNGGTNVTLQTTASSASGPGVVNASGNGDITIAAPMTWGSAATLTLDAYRNIDVHAAVDITGAGKIDLEPSNGFVDFGLTSSGFEGSIVFAGTPHSGQALTINGQSATLIYSMSELASIDGGSGFYALAKPLNASGTNYGGAVIGTFYGGLSGLGNTISDLTISGSGDNIGLIGTLGGEVDNLGLLNESILGRNNVGGLVGDLCAGCAVVASYSTGTVAGTQNVGGLVGATEASALYNPSTKQFTNITQALIDVAFSDATVVGVASSTSPGVNAGGLVGSNEGNVQYSYANGTVEAGSGAEGNFGGLVGLNRADSNLLTGIVGNVSNSYASGIVIVLGDGTALNNSLGGLAGANNGTISTSHATGPVDGGRNAGGLVGDNAASISNSYATGDVADGEWSTGGLVGFNFAEDGATIVGSYATGNVKSSANGAEIGGLVGDEFGYRLNQSPTIQTSYATGRVEGDGAGDMVGGLVGRILDGGLVVDSYAQGAVTAAGANSYAGGFIGAEVDTTADSSSGQVAWAYATGRVLATGTGVIGGGFLGAVVNPGDTPGLAVAEMPTTQVYYDYQTTGMPAGTQADLSTGLSTAALQGTLPAGFSSSVWGTGTGLYPYLKTFGAVSPLQVVSGFAYNANGMAANAGTIDLYIQGALLGSASTGANGYYYYLAPSASVSATSDLGGTLTLSGASSPSGATFTDRPTFTGSDVTGFNITSGKFTIGTQDTTYSGLLADLNSTFGASTYANLANALNGAASLKIEAANGFNIDAPLSWGGNVLVQSDNGNLSIASGANVASTATGDAVVLAANGSFVNSDGANAVETPNGRWLIYSQAQGNSVGTATSDNVGGLAGENYYGDAFSFATSSFVSALGPGDRFVQGFQPTLTVSAGTQSVTYNGASQTDSYKVSGYLGNDAAQDSLTGSVSGLTTSSKNVGTYLLTTSGNLASDENYAISYDSGTLTITPALLTLSAATDTKIYDGTTNSIGRPSALGLMGGDSVSNLNQSFDSKNAGSRTLTVNSGYMISDGNGGGNYQVVVDSVAGTITPAPLTIFATSDSKTYDGAITSDATPTYSGLISGDTLTSLSQSYDSKNAGSRTLTVNGVYSLSDGNGGNNYTVQLVDAPGTITPASLTIYATTDSKTYDGTTTSTATPTSSGLQGTDTLTDLSESYDSKNAGYRTLSVDASFNLSDGNGGNNYVVQLVDAPGYISPAPLTIFAVPDAKTYDATTASTASPIFIGLVGADTLTGLSESYDSKNAGSRNMIVDPSYNLSDGNGGSNYAVTFEQAPGAITPSIIGLSLIGTSKKTYDATTNALLTSDNYAYSGFIASGDDVNILLPAIGQFSDKNVGTEKLVTVSGIGLSGTDAQNYKLLDNGVAQGNIGEIDPAPLTLSLVSGCCGQGISKIYDSTTTAFLSDSNYELKGYYSGDDVNIIYPTVGQYADKNVGSNKLVTVSGISISGSDANNYTINSDTSAYVGTITPAPVYVNLTGSVEKYYDQNSEAQLSPNNFLISGVYSGDDVQFITASGGQYDDPNPGFNKAVFTSGFSIRGADSGNYYLANNSASGNIGTIKVLFDDNQLSLINNLNLGDLYDSEANLNSDISGNQLGIWFDQETISGMQEDIEEAFQSISEFNLGPEYIWGVEGYIESLNQNISYLQSDIANDNEIISNDYSQLGDVDGEISLLNSYMNSPLPGQENTMFRSTTIDLSSSSNPSDFKEEDDPLQALTESNPSGSGGFKPNAAYYGVKAAGEWLDQHQSDINDLNLVAMYATAEFPPLSIAFGLNYVRGRMLIQVAETAQQLEATASGLQLARAATSKAAAEAALETVEAVATDTLPSDVQVALEDIESGAARPNIRNSQPYKNDGRDGTTLLPVDDASGQSITYTEYYVNQKLPGAPMDAKRIVVGSDGSVWYTPDHYLSWFRVKQ